MVARVDVVDLVDVVVFYSRLFVSIRGYSFRAKWWAVMSIRWAR